MKIFLIMVGVLILCLISISHSLAADTSVDSIKTVVPSQEKEIAQKLSAEGPTETIGIESSEILGSISLAGEFAGTDGYMLRVRKVTVLPGAQVAVHQHTSRPGAAYILEGELIEHRNDSDDPITRKAGNVALEKTGTIHWWKNESSSKAIVIVVDIVPMETE
jgi:quercetin dioxygenase-like cupin family protein